MTMTGTAPMAREVLEGDLTIYSALEQKRHLLGLLADGAALEIDLGRVGSIDASGIQLLILVKREAAARGADVRFVGHSQSVGNAIEFCNLAATLGDPLLITGRE